MAPTDPSKVSAIIVTRGNVDLRPIIETLPYDEIIVWDNSLKSWNASCFGRFLAIEEARHETIYFQDDDIIFTEHDALCAAHDPQKARFTANMPRPWGDWYAERNMALVGAGSLVPRNLPWAAFGRYLAVYPKDHQFLDYCDMVHGVLTPGTAIDLGYTVLPYASDEGRIYTSPGAFERKVEVIQRAIGIRENLRD